MKRSGYEYESSGGKGAEGGKGEGKGAPRRNAGTTKIELPCVMKCLAPEVLASAIIGKQGLVIAQIRTSCSAKLALTEHGEFYPSTEARVLTAQANDKESLNEVAKQIIAKVAEVAKSGAVEGVGTDGNLTFKTLVPRAAVGGIIGKGGNTIKQLRETSNAKISISDAVGSGPGSEQVVSIQGTVEAIELVMTEVNNQTSALHGESWFQTWAATTGASYGGYGAAASSYASGYSAAGAYPSSMRGYQQPGIDVMMQVANSLPSYVMEDTRGFALSCVVPNTLVGGLIGRGGNGTKEVQARTGCEIRIRPCENDEESRTLQINGPLANTCAAYMLMMKRYLDAEAQAAQQG